MVLRGLSRAALSFCALVPFGLAIAQNPEVKANWELANRYSPEALRPFVYSTNLNPGFINKTDVFWYSWKDSKGVKFWKVDPRSKQKTSLFDSDKMAAMLTELSRKPYDSNTLPITTVTFDEKNANLVLFTVDGVRYQYDSKTAKLKLAPVAPPANDDNMAPPPDGGRRGGGRGQGGPGGPPVRDFKNTSPDKKAYVYAQDHNLFYVQVVDGKDQAPVQLTKDGEKNYSFGSAEDRARFQQLFQQRQQQQRTTTTTDNVFDSGQNAKPETRVRANVVWSSDSKRFYVTRRDSRKIKELWLVNNLADPRPTLMTYQYEMPGEAEVGQTELFAFDPSKKALIKLKIEKYKDQDIFNLHWQDKTSDFVRFVRRDRLQRNLEFVDFDLVKNEPKVLLSESIENAALETQDARYVKPGGDFVWYSERTGWGQYYLYSNDGKLKNPITAGAFHCARILELDGDKGFVWFQAQGKEPNENAYYKHVYRCKLDGSDWTLLDSGDFDHNSVLSPSKNYLVDVYSRTDTAPKAVLRDEWGKVILDLEETDLSKLNELGWKLPERFTVKAADGITDIYGNMWKPIDFDPKRKYPIIAYVYPGPQTEAVSAGFGATSLNQRLAQLGFIVIQIGNRGGSPDRSTAYHRYGYFNLRDYGLADKKVGIEQLAAKYSWIDVNKVGIFGHSGGGFMTGAALLLPPYNDFFKVGVSSSGNHDNNVYNSGWSENNHGLKEVPVKDKDGKDTAEKKFEIKVPTNIEIAANLKGKLLLVTGDMDNNVHPANTIRLVNALIRANKRFDFMIMPGQAHGYGDMTAYFNQLTLEYFAEHLLGDYYRKSADMKSTP